MEYTDTINKLEHRLVRHESGDVSLGQFTLPKGLQHRQYVGIVAMFEALELQKTVWADPPHCSVTYEDVANMRELANQLMNAKGTV